MTMRDLKSVCEQKQFAYSTLEVKEITETADVWTITGIATTPRADLMEDVVEPMGARFSLPISLLWQHMSDKPIGNVTFAKMTKSGIPYTAEIPKVKEPGVVKDRIDEVIHSIKYKLVAAVSIGFKPVRDQIEQLKNGGLRFKEWLWLELSVVTIPANMDATITSIKSIDRSQRAALGFRAASDGLSPARAGASSSTQGNVMETMQEQVTALRTTLDAQQGRMKEIEGEVEAKGFTSELRTEVNDLASSISDTEARIQMKESQIAMSKRAVPVASSGGSAAPYGFAKKFADRDERFKGETGLMRVMCQLASSLDMKQGRGFRRPSEVAEYRYGKSHPSLVAVMKANEVPGAGSGSGEALAELVAADNRFTGDFIEYLYGQTVFDQIPFREVPRNVAIKGMDGAYTGYWVGESKPIPMSQGSASSTSTTPLKVAGLTVLSNELIRDSSPAALDIAGSGLRSAIAQTVDTKAFSADAASAGVSPAGLLNGLAAISTNGGDVESVKTDIKALFAPFITAKNASGFAWVMTPTTALSLSLMQNALGQTAFPGLTAGGGNFQGFPAYVGDNIGAGDVILLQPKEIWKIADTGVDVSISTEAMIEQSSAPTGATDTPTAASQAFTSMFQEESTAVKVVRGINWGKRRSSAVAYVGDAAWGSENS